MKNRITSGALVLLLLLGIFTLANNVQPVRAHTWYVSPTNGFPDIQGTINYANNGDTILVDPGTYYENIVINKSVSLIGADQSTTIIDGSRLGNVVNVTAPNVVLSGFTIQKNGNYGVYVTNDGNTISDNIIYDNGNGAITVISATKSTIQRNVLKMGVPQSEGIRVISSLEIAIIDNKLSVELGIWLDSSNSCLVLRNNITETHTCGIAIDHGLNNSVSQNCISGAPYHGVWMSYSENNSITKNTINGGWGSINLYYSSNNTFNLNNINNQPQHDWMGNLLLNSSPNNSWDMGYPAGGNYWADYTDIDVHSGSSQNLPGRDGIWDHARLVDAENIDHYPLTVPYAEWDLKLTASVDAYSDLSTAGVRVDSMLGFDAAFDEVDAPAPPTGVISYFWSPSNPTFPIDMRSMQKSMIPMFDNLTWTYKVEAIGVEGSSSVSWDSSDIANIPNVYSVLLLDSNGQTLADMRKTTQYSYAASTGVTYNFTVRVFASETLSLNLVAGWNMVSFPVVPADNTVASVFCGIPYYQIITWSGTSYITPTSIEAAKGYWVLVLSPITLNVTDLPTQQYEKDLPVGWSMIGSVCDRTVGSGTVFSGFYQLMSWTGTSYVDAKTAGIESGKGYWALVLTPTHIAVG